METRSTLSRREDFTATAIPLLDGLYGAAVRMSGSRSDADDLVQETLLLGYQSFHRFEPGTNARAWLHRILVNAFISGYRRRQRERRALDVEGDPRKRELFLSDDQARLDGRDGGVQLASLGRGLQEALDALPAEFRAVVVMADLHDASYREIADALGCPMGTVMSRLHRARRALAKALAIDPRTGERVEAA